MNSVSGGVDRQTAALNPKPRNPKSQGHHVRLQDGRACLHRHIQQPYIRQPCRGERRGQRHRQSGVHPSMNLCINLWMCLCLCLCVHVWPLRFIYGQAFMLVNPFSYSLDVRIASGHVHAIFPSQKRNSPLHIQEASDNPFMAADFSCLDSFMRASRLTATPCSPST